MLGDKDAMPTIGVKDLEVASDFYEGTLGLTAVHVESTEAIVYRSGNTTVMVYKSEYAGTNQATYMSWVVGDELERVVGELKSKGISFEHYELPGVTREGDVHVMGDLRAVWFKDPDGNILNLVNQSTPTS